IRILKDITYEYLQLIRNFAGHFIPIFCICGIIGNSMALILLRTDYLLKRLTSNLYLFILSLSGCLFLATVFICWVDAMLIELPVYSNSEFGCRFLTFVAHMSDFNCAYMISWVSCDRAAVLFRPRSVSRVCTRNFIQFIVYGTILFSCLLYSLCFILAGLETAGGKEFCGLTKNITFIGADFHNQLYFYFTLIDTVICTVFPSIIIFIVNSIAIYRYRQCMKLYTSGAIKVRFENNENETTPAVLNSNRQTLIIHSAKSNTCKMRYSDLKLSFSLIIATSTFVCLTFPNYCFRIYNFWFDPTSPYVSFASFVTHLLHYLHHAILAYIYVFWSPHMKKQLKPAALRLLECYCFKSAVERDLEMVVH
uniref:G_PROTEIN_RECEP_F1_2 domain-containing protein n=1 Tax=Syphacia muris TaxID=451379 RepID=A0A0N5ADG1_9BILA